MRKIILLSVAAILTCSCGIYSKYEHQEFPDIEVADSVQLPKWKEIFTDICLQSLIDSALVHNSDIQIARLKTIEAGAQLKKANLAFLPSLDINLNAAKSQPYTLAAASSWEIDIFGKLTNERRRAEASMEEARAYEQAVKTQLIATVAQSYYTLQGLDNQLKISIRTLENWDRTLEVMEALKEAGRSTNVAVLQTKAKRGKLESSVMSIKQNITETRNALCTLAGCTLKDIERSEMTEHSIPVFVSSVPLGIVAARPDVRASEMQLAQAFYVTNAARSAFYPSIKLSGSAGWMYDGKAITDPVSFIWNAAGSLLQPVFNRRANKSALEIARAKQEAALVSFRQTLLNAGKEVNNAITGYQTATDKLKLDRDRARILKNAADKIELVMKHSETNYLEVLTAQQSLLESELDIVNDMVSMNASLVALYRSLGGGTQ